MGINSVYTVCHVISGDLWAGAETVVYNLVTSLLKFNLNVVVVLFNDEVLAKELRKKNVKVYIIDETKKSFFRMVLELKRICFKEKIDIIHSHRYKENLLSYFSTMGKIPLLTTIHGITEVSTFSKQKIIDAINRLFIKTFFNKIVAVSVDIEKLFIYNFGFSKQKLCSISNGIIICNDFNKQDSNAQFVIGTAGRLVSVKNYGFLLDIVAKLRNSDMILKIAGDGPELANLKRKCNELNIVNKVHFCGNIYNMSVFYKSLDIYINTSLHEGIPMTILEAMSFYLPVIAPMVGGIPEIIDHNVDGFLVPAGNKEMFANYCVKLSENRELCREMGNNARNKIMRSFSIQACAEKYHKIYSDLHEKQDKHNVKNTIKK